MIEIDSAIEESKHMPNVSNGGSECFDFGNVVLVKYSSSKKYLKDGEHTREKSEEIMEAINKKADNGVNVPRHLAIKRVIEGDNDICYVLQQKCPGINCRSMSKYGVSFEEMCDSLKFILNIPFYHYKKLIEDGCNLFEMGYEAKNKNLFYDSNRGFWYIDFLSNNVDNIFDYNDIIKIFKALKYMIPKPIQIASMMEYNAKLTDNQQDKMDELRFAVKAKTLLAIKTVLPNFERYEKFFLLDEPEKYRKYLMQNKIVNKDLININESDYEIFQELYKKVMYTLMDKVIYKGVTLSSIEANDIGNDSDLFNLQIFFEKSKFNKLNISDFEDSYDYGYEVRKKYEQIILSKLIDNLKKIKPNNNVNEFVKEIEKKYNLPKKSI